ncbi:hypothetical protein HS99_0008860 [Kitasatospora aureofaciens]|uniref:IS110 family transposase n=1 Tax=Kitasatospora aureofaciens TaxID=1894 RepID=A0A1E7N1P7_KITAU|nr:hypothetical protein B6264_26935 [Kitasatospora aureofaciens]OEV34601.1 hypothetical protein HS99_0008860 [Kitasatospora aureofaciens]
MIGTQDAAAVSGRTAAAGRNATRQWRHNQVSRHTRGAEGKSHKQAVLALARRRLDVLWALIRDHRTFAVEPPQHDLATA